MPIECTYSIHNSKTAVDVVLFGFGQETCDAEFSFD